MSAEGEFLRQAVNDRTELEVDRQKIVDEIAIRLADLAKLDYRWQRFSRGVSPDGSAREVSELIDIATDRAKGNARDRFYDWYGNIPENER